MDSLELEYEPTIEDGISIQDRIDACAQDGKPLPQKTAPWAWLFVAVMVPVSAVLFAVTKSTAFDLESVFCVLMAIFVPVGILIHLYVKPLEKLRNRAIRADLSNPAHRVLMHLKFGPTELSWSHSVIGQVNKSISTVIRKWNSVEWIELRGSRAFIFSHPKHLIMIPESSFADRESFERFVDQLQRLRRAAEE